jgi:hypothetical protein
MFDLFRRHQKRWMAALVVMAMAAFAFPVTSFMGNGGRVDRESQIEVVDTVYGREITNVDVYQARQDRLVANRFVQEMLLSAEPRMAAFIANLNYFGPIQSDDAIIDALRLSHKADQYGIRINDDAIRAWITRMTDGKLTTEQFQAVVASLRVSPQTLFELVRRQLAIQQVEELALGRFARSAQVTPYEAWQFYRRLNEKVGVDLIAVPVSNFTTDVADPSDSELRALYASSIHRLPDPASPEPGFKEPRKVQLQYATASLDPFLLALKPELNVSDDEVKEYYESHKELYRILPSDEKKEEPAEPKPTESKPDESKPDEPKSDKPDESAKPDEPAKGKEDKKDDKPDAPKEDAPAKKEDAPAKDDPKPEPKVQDDGDEAVQLDDQEPEGAKADEAKQKATDTDKPAPVKSEEKKADEKPAASDAPTQPEKKESSVPAQEEPKQEKKADDKAEPAKDQPKSEPAEPKADSDAADVKKDAAEKKAEEPKYKPLEEVSGDIRDRLLRQKARDELVRRMEKVQNWVNQYADDNYLPAKNAFEEAKADEKIAADSKFQPPKPPDLTKQVEELGFKFADTGLVSLEDELDKIPGLGEANEFSGDTMSGRTVRGVMDEADLYDPIVFKNYKDEFFTVWKADDAEANEPPFEKIRASVLAAYKGIKAREKARQHADRIAQSVRDAAGDMAKVREAFPGIDPLTISPVPLWSSAGSLSPNRFMGFGRVEPVQLPGIRFPSEDFHTSLFKTKEGDVAVLSNQPEDAYYVVRVAKREPTTYEAFANSRRLVEDQLQSIRNSENAAQWLTDLRRESSPKKSTAPAGN